MKKIIKLTESDLTKIVKRLVKESDKDDSYYENFKQADDYASDLYFEMDNELQEIFDNILNNTVSLNSSEILFLIKIRKYVK